MRTGLSQMHDDVPEEAWPSTCMPLAPDAPAQNPREEVWLKGQNVLRNNLMQPNTLARVQQCFVAFLSSLSFNASKFDWYYP